MISCVLLAAGESLRFGGSPKALARLGPKTVLKFILNKLLESEISEVILVLGADADLITPHIPADRRIKTVFNKNFHLGQTSSFKTGLANLEPQTEGTLLLPVDMPLVKSKTIDVLIEAFLKNSKAILIPVWQGKKGHPPIFSKKLFQEFNNLKDDEPLSSIQRKHEEDTLLFAVEDKGVVQSFNTQEEFAQIVKSSLSKSSRA